MDDNINTFTLIFCEEISYFVQYPEERYIRRTCFAFAFSDVSTTFANDLATLNEKELERYAEFIIVFADIPQRFALDTETLVTDNHLVRYAITTNAFLFNRMTLVTASADGTFSEEPITRNSSSSGGFAIIAHGEQSTLYTRSMTVFHETEAQRVTAGSNTVFTEVLIARNPEFNFLFDSSTVEDTVNTEAVVHEEQQTLYETVSTVSPGITSLQEITNAETVYTEKELLRNSGFTLVFVYTPLQYVVNEEQQSQTGI